MSNDPVARRNGRATIFKSILVGIAAVLAMSSPGLAADAAGSSPEAVESPAPSNRISVRISEALGNDPEAIFGFVSEHVRYEPYSGALRGAQGTYYSRAGNSVDQALLLARLLDAAAIQTRFAVGRLDDEAAAALLASGAADESALREQAAMGLFGRLPADNDPVPAFPRAVEYAPTYQDDQEAAAEAWARAQLTDTLTMIESAIDEAGLAVEGGFTAIPDDERSQHTWIQASIGSEWIDLDPSLPGLGFGETMAQALETMDAIPDERRHMVGLAVVAESLEDGVLVEEELLRHDAPADELADASITISNIGSAAVPQLARAFEGVLGVLTYNPVLVIDDWMLAGQRMHFKDPAAEGGGGLGGGFFDTGPATVETTAEWIELTVQSPGRDPVTVRRTMFDRVGDAARELGSLDIADLPALDSVVADDEGRTELVPLLTTWWLDVSTGTPSLRSRAIGLDADDVRRLVVIPYAHHLLTSMAGLDLAVPMGARPFVDAPNISAATISVEVGPEGELAFEPGIDIWHRSRGVAAVPGAEAVGEPASIPGVMAHVTERMIGGDAAGGEAGEGPISVGALFDAATADGVGIHAIDASFPLAELPYPTDALRHLERSLADGWLAVVPERPVVAGGSERVGWWLVDPTTGRVVDQMDDGRGATFGETVTFENVAAAFAAIGAGTIFALGAQALVEFFTDVQWERANDILIIQLVF